MYSGSKLHEAIEDCPKFSKSLRKSQEKENFFSSNLTIHCLVREVSHLCIVWEERAHFFPNPKQCGLRFFFRLSKVCDIINKGADNATRYKLFKSATA